LFTQTAEVVEGFDGAGKEEVAGPENAYVEEVSVSAL
jgi:hypothetical protein